MVLVKVAWYPEFVTLRGNPMLANLKVEHGDFEGYRCRRFRNREVILFIVLLVTYAYTGNKLAADFCRLAPAASTSDGPATSRIERLLCGSKYVVSRTPEPPCHLGTSHLHAASAATHDIPVTASTTSHTKVPTLNQEEICSSLSAEQCGLKNAGRSTGTIATIALQLLKRMLVSQADLPCHLSVDLSSPQSHTWCCIGWPFSSKQDAPHQSMPDHETWPAWVDLVAACRAGSPPFNMECQPGYAYGCF